MLNENYGTNSRKFCAIALQSGEDYPAAQQLFFQQHAMLHRAEMAGAGLWSYEDQVWQGLSEADARRIPPEQTIRSPGSSGILPVLRM